MDNFDVNDNSTNLFLINHKSSEYLQFFQESNNENEMEWDMNIFLNPDSKKELDKELENQSINQEVFIEYNQNQYLKESNSKEIIRENNYSLVPTRDKTGNINDSIERNTKVLFQVKKTGRKNKNNTLNEVSDINKKVHSKYQRDNLIRKIRIYLIKFAKNLLNDCIKKDFGTKSIQQIKGIVQELTSDITISFNIEFFNSTLERIFSNPLNKKYKKMDEAHNINEIKKIKQKINKASLTNELLNKTLLEVYDWFIQKDNYEYYYDRYGKGENTYNLKEFLNTLKNKETDDYIKDLEKEGMKLIESFDHKKARKVQKKRKIKFKGTNFEGYY